MNCPEIGLFSQGATFVVPASTNIVQTSGYSVAGKGAARYAVTSNTGANGYRFQSADGRWFELSEPAPSPEMFGAIGDGVSDDTSALQAAITYAAARLLPLQLAAASYSISTVAVSSNARIHGAGTNLTSINGRAGAGAAPLNTLVVVSNIELTDLTVNGLSNADNRPLMSIMAGSNIAVARVRFYQGMKRWALSLFYASAGRNLTIDSCVFDTVPAGGILISANNGIGVRNIVVENCLWTNWGNNGFQMNNNGTNAYDTYVDVRVSDNVMTDPIFDLITYSNGPIPFEHWGCTNYVASGNIIDGGTRGMTAGAYMKNGTISGNIVRNQTAYFAEAGVPCQDIVVANNYVKDCNMGIAWTAAGSLSNYVIDGNVFDGTGATSYNSGNPASIFKSSGAGASNLFYDLVIRNNLIKKAEFTRFVADIRINDTDKRCSVEFSSNNVVLNDAKSPQVGLNISGFAVLIKNNVIRRTADIDGSTHYQGNSAGAMISVSNQAAGSSCIVTGNSCENLGTVTGSNICGVGNMVAGTLAFPGVTVMDNTVLGSFGVSGYGIYLPATSGDTVVKQNSVGGVVQGTPISLNAAVQYYEAPNKFTRSAVPAAGNWALGDLVFNSSPAASGFVGWVCVAGGSPGTWKTFGSIAP